MMRWLISVPAWGERYVGIFCTVALPALEKAVTALVSWHDKVDPVIVVHTDQPERVSAASRMVGPIEVRPLPAGTQGFGCLSQSHREVLAMACRGDVVVLLTADLVISQEGLCYCSELFARRPRSRLVACAGVRALDAGRPPDTVSAEALMRWAWAHRHPITEAGLWPRGTSADLSRLYFELGAPGREADGVVVRLALPHPLAVLMDGRPLPFGPTIDANLIQCFDPAEIHLVQQSDELALVELSPPDKEFQRAAPVEDRLSAGEFVIRDKLQRWCFHHPVWLIGGPSLPDQRVDDYFVAKEVLRR